MSDVEPPELDGDAMTDAECPAEVTPDMLGLLWHMLGMDTSNYRLGLEWWLDNDNHRNHFFVRVDLGDLRTIIGPLDRLGFIRRSGTLPGGKTCLYHATDEGIGVARGAFFGRQKEERP
jgi:hypothetical protein